MNALVNRSLVFVVAFVALGLVPLSGRADLINAVAQPGFEVDDGTWTHLNAFAEFHDGHSPPHLLAHSGSEFGLMGGDGYLAQMLVTPVPIGAFSQLSMYASIWDPGGTTTVTLQVTLDYATGEPTSGQLTFQNINQWVLYDFTASVDPTREITAIRLDHLTHGYLAVDDVALLYVPEPGPFTLVTFGFGLFALSRRRRGHRPTNI